MGNQTVVHITPSVSHLAGGLSESVRHLAQNISNLNEFKISIMGFKDSHTERDLCAWYPLEVEIFPVAGPRRFGFSQEFAHALRTRAPNLVHLHGLWQYSSLTVLNWARKTKEPYIISPHGMLEPWALTQSRFTKKLAGWLYQRASLHGAAVIWATSKMEADNIREVGFRNPIALIPNGVEASSVQTSEARIERTEDGSRKSAIRRVLFLSRIHPKKGLLNLVKAWEMVNRKLETGNRKLDDWELLIVGPDENGHLTEVQAEVRNAGLEGQIRFQGEVMGKAKMECYRMADLFVLPSFSENFGLVIAEALSCGVPVITTRATPWEELETRRCGWWIETGVEPLAKALREAMTLSNVERMEMGLRGRQLVEDRYTWPAISRQMCAAYKWVLDGGPKPEFII